MYYVSHRTAVRNKIKDMQITKKALYIWCVVLAVFLIGSVVSFVFLSKKISEKRELERFEAAYEKAVEAEYEDLVSEYEYLSDIVTDKSYSYKFRFKYAIELNRLIENYPYSDGFEFSTVDRCIEALKENEEEFKERFRRQAELNVYKRYFGEE